MTGGDGDDGEAEDTDPGASRQVLPGSIVSRQTDRTRTVSHLDGQETIEFWEVEVEYLKTRNLFIATLHGRDVPRMQGRGRDRYVALARLYYKVSDFFVELAAKSSATFLGKAEERSTKKK